MVSDGIKSNIYYGHVNNQWSSLDNEPDIPLLRGGLKTAHKKETLSKVIAGAATAFAKALTPQRMSPPKKQSSVQTSVSPASKAKLSGAYISQLRELQLRESGVLDEDEFQEQKRFALDDIRGMNK